MAGTGRRTRRSHRELRISLPDAVRSCLTQYATFPGRARRSEYWYFVVASFLAAIVASIIDSALGTRDVFGGTGLIDGLLSLFLILPSLAVSVRRLHDIDRSGWWVLIGAIPLIGVIVLLVWACQGSRPANRYGPDPKGIDPPGCPTYPPTVC